MDLEITNIQLKNFRGYKHIDLTIEKPLVVLIGSNAVGKTNIIEGLRLLTYGESFKKGKTENVISFGENAGMIACTFSQGKREITHTISLKNNKKYFLLNGKKKQKKAFRQTCSSVLFVPDDLNMIKAASSCRREALDTLGVCLSARYAQLKSDFNTCLKQRNKLIKEEDVNTSVLELWTESFIVHAARLCYNRQKLFNALKEEFIKIYKNLSPYSLDVTYIPSWLRLTETGRTINDYNVLEEVPHYETSLEEIQSQLKKAFLWALPFEMQRKTSLLGPQKDDIGLFIEAKNARIFASQGQQRTLTLAWKLAETCVIGKINHQHPILFLDDVMSELDKNHRQALLSYLPKTSQTFITATDLSCFPPDYIKNAQIIDVKEVKMNHET